MQSELYHSPTHPFASATVDEMSPRMNIKKAASRDKASASYATLNLPIFLRVVFSLTTYKHLSEGGRVAMEKISGKPDVSLQPLVTSIPVILN